MAHKVRLAVALIILHRVGVKLGGKLAAPLVSRGRGRSRLRVRVAARLLRQPLRGRWILLVAGGAVGDRARRNERRGFQLLRGINGERVGREVVGMGCDFGRDSSSRQRPLLSRAVRVGNGLGKVGKRALGASEVPRCRVEDGIFLGKTGGPAGRIVEAALGVFGSLEDGAREDGRGRRLFRGGRLSVWMITKAAERP